MSLFPIEAPYSPENIQSMTALLIKNSAPQITFGINHGSTQDISSHVGTELKSIIADLPDGFTEAELKAAIQQSMFLPELSSNSLYFYTGNARFHIFNLGQLFASVSAGLFRHQPRKKRKEVLFLGENFVSYKFFFQYKMLFEYKNGAILNINPLNLFAKKEKRIEIAFRNPVSKTDHVYILDEGKTAVGFLCSLEKYSATGQVEPDYSYDLVKILELDKDHLSRRDRAKVLAEDLGI